MSNFSFLNFQCQALRMAHINSTTSRLCCSPLLFDHQVLMFGLHQICKLPISSRSILLKFQEYFVWKSFLREAELLVNWRYLWSSWLLSMSANFLDPEIYLQPGDQISRYQLKVGQDQMIKTGRNYFFNY